MDRASVIGILIGVGAVIGGNYLEGGRPDAIFQPTAALIVFGGTVGATLLSFPFSDITKAAAALGAVFFGKRPDPEALVQDLLRCSATVRKQGIVSLERELSFIEHPFLAKAVQLAVDGMHPKVLRETLEQEIDTFAEERKRVSRVFDTAGGFAPTIGIIGAVLGLIHVMENLSDPAKLGSGIAVAFVATVYGVGSANLLLLPVSKKLMHQLRREIAIREMIIEGVVGVQEGLNPHYLEARVRACVEQQSDARGEP
jgi:chemotaxis protein MotA